MDRIAELAAEHDRRRDDQRDGEQHDQRRPEPLLAADLASQQLVERPENPDGVRFHQAAAVVP